MNELNTPLLKPIECETIARMHEKNERFFVYFGSRNSLDIGGKMNFLEKLAAFDRFQYFDEDK